MRIFDFHVHIFPDKIAKKTVAMLGKEAGLKPAYDGTRNGLRKAMQTAGIDGALNCPIATRPEQVDSINAWAEHENYWPVLSLGTVHPDSPNLAACMRHIKQHGMPGIKLHPEYQRFRPDDDRMLPIWETCSDLGLLVLMHCGEDIGFEPPYHSSPREIADLLDRFPDLVLVAAHMGSWRLWDDVEAVLCGRANLYLETSFTLDMTTQDQFMRMVGKHGPRHILFGTDAPWRTPVDAVRRIRDLPLKTGDRDDILWNNAERLLARHGVRIDEHAPPDHYSYGNDPPLKPGLAT